MSQSGEEVWSEEEKEGRIGMGYITHNKDIHPHYCNNPPATHQCGISIAQRWLPSSSSTHIAGNTFPIDTIRAQQILNSRFIHSPSYLISDLRNKITFWCNIVSQERFHTNTSVRLRIHVFLWLPHCKLITYSCSVHEKKAEGSTGRIKALKHTHIHTNTSSCKFNILLAAL